MGLDGGGGIMTPKSCGLSARGSSKYLGVVMRKTIYLGVASILFVATMAFFACNNGQGGNKGGNGTTENGNQNTPNDPSNPSGPKVPEHIKLQFDKNKMTCKNNRGVAIESGSEVKVGEVYQFTATLAAGRAVDKWAVNGQDWFNGNSFSYRVRERDAKTANPIVISYRDKVQETFTVEFDGDKIKCNQYVSSDNYISVSSGGSLKEGETYEFEPKDGAIEAGKIIKEWLINDNSINETHYDTYGQTSFEDVFSRSDANSEGKIKISFTTKDAEEVIVKFDESKIKCKTVDSNSTTLSTGTRVKEGEHEGYLLFEATKISDAQKIKNWRVNGANAGYKGRLKFYWLIDARKKDSNGAVTIDFEEN